MRTISLATAAVCFSLALPVAAKQNLDAHVHGTGEVNLAQEGQSLYIELTLPAHDALGFETIKTKAQKKALYKALETMEAPGLWVLPASAECKLVEAHASAGGHDHDDDHDHHHDSKHDHHDDHNHHHDSKHDDEHDHHDHSEHLDLQATYNFTCNVPANLSSIKTDLFNRFERSEKLSLQGLTDRGSVKVTLAPAKPEAAL